MIHLRFLPQAKIAALAIVTALALSASTLAQSPPPAPQPEQPAPPAGKVIFSRDVNSPDSQPAESLAATKPDDALAVTDAERNALTFTAYDLDVHLTPASAGIAVRAGLTVRNDSAAPLKRLALDITSSLHWDAFSTHAAPLPLG